MLDMCDFHGPETVGIYILTNAFERTIEQLSIKFNLRFFQKNEYKFVICQKFYLTICFLTIEFGLFPDHQKILVFSLTKPFHTKKFLK